MNRILPPASHHSTTIDKGDDKAYNQLLSCCQYDKTYILNADSLMNAVQVWFLLFLWVI